MKRTYLLNALVHSFLLLTVGIFPLTLKADPIEISITEAGTGASQFAAHSTATDLTIKGKINQIDLLELHANCRKLQRLNLSNAEIEAYSDEESYIDYNANELSTALSNSPELVDLILPKTLNSILAKALQKCPKLESITLPGEKVVTAKSLFVDKKSLAKIKLYVPEALVEEYKKQSKTVWGFSEILPIKQEPTDPFAGVEFENIYGPNYFPITEGEPSRVFYAFFFNNGSKQQIDRIEFTYWFDFDESTKKTLEIKEVQLLPGSNMNDMQQACIFSVPDDTELHLIHVKPTKLNGETVDLGERVRPYRRYHVAHGPIRQHQMEFFLDPNDNTSMEGYKRILTSMITLLGKTQKPDKITFVTIPGQIRSEKFIPEVPELEALAQQYRITSTPLLMYNRNLMNPYGTLNNDKELADRSIYTPALRVSTKLEDIHSYLFSNGFHTRAFTTLNIGMERTPEQQFALRLTGTLSVDENRKNDLRAQVYLVENSELPTFDRENETVEFKGNAIYNKVIKSLTPIQGTPISIQQDGSFTLDLPAFELKDFADNKYRITASIFRQGTAEKPYQTSILQSATTAIDEALLTHNSKVQPMEEPSLSHVAGTLYTDSMEWTIHRIYTLRGEQIDNGTLTLGCYIVQLLHSSGTTQTLKYIL